MSSSSAGKFQDHYEVLGVDHKATPEAIRAAYARLAEQHNPENGGVLAKHDAVILAFEVLSDPDLRKDFNKLKGIDSEGPPQFSGQPFFDALGRDERIRQSLLCILYDRRRQKPFTPSLSMRNLENMMQATVEELNLALWYLKKRALVDMDDKSSMQITVEGIDFVEAQLPSPAIVLPMLKPEAVKAMARPEPVVEVAVKVEAAPDDGIVEESGLVNLAEALAEEGSEVSELPRVPSLSAAGSAARIGSILFGKG
ncbi:MAG: J domain-containing protein [Acidobacteriota bacterium]